MAKTDILSLSWKTHVSRFSFPILVMMAVALLIYSQIGQNHISALRTKVVDMTAPVISVVATPFSAVSNKVGQITNIHTLRAENIQLTQENERLREWYETALRLNAENQSLRDLLNLKKDPELSYLTTRVIADPGGNFVKTLIVPVGLADGVAKGHAVLSEHGMIGRVTEVGQNTARILLVTDLNSRIPVMIQGTHQKAILAGQNTNTMRLEHFSQDSGVEIGSQIVTSGHGGVLPPNLKVGVVSDIKDGQVIIKPMIDINSLSFVQVVKNTPVFIDGRTL